MAGEIAFEFAGRAKLMHLLDSARAAVVDARPFFRDYLIPDIRKMYRAQFDTQGSRGGETWEPLSPAYAAWKESHFPGKTILRRTDRLFDSLVGKTADSIQAMDQGQLRIGTKLVYGRAHQDGTSTLPARPLLAPTGGDIRRWRQLGERYMRDSLRGSRARFI